MTQDPFFSPQEKAAIKRGFFLALGAGIAATIAWAATKPEYAVAAGIAGAMFGRFLEGVHDSKRAELGDVSKADVGYTVGYDRGVKAATIRPGLNKHGVQR